MTCARRCWASASPGLLAVVRGSRPRFSRSVHPVPLLGPLSPFLRLKPETVTAAPSDVKMSPLSPIALLCALLCKAAFLVCGTEGEPRHLLLLLPGRATAPSSNDFFKGSKSLMLWLPICKNAFMMQKLVGL